MSCQGSGKPDATEFDFFQQMLKYPDILICCGPLTQIGFTGPSLLEFRNALMAAGCSEDYLDLYEHEVLDSGYMSVKMCAKHWIEHARSAGAAGIAHSNPAWETIASHIFKVTSLTNDWDFKEILNFVKTVYAVNKARGEKD